MKALLIFSGLIILSLSTMSYPTPAVATNLINNKTVRDLSQDDSFVKTLIEVYTIQTRIMETNSAGLMKQASIGDLTNTEQEMLAKNLGFHDYATLNESFNKIGNSMLALKNKYAELNDQSNSSAVIHAAILKLIDQGKITIQKNTNTSACLCALYAAILNCLKTSANCTALHSCLCAAYAAYLLCGQNR